MSNQGSHSNHRRTRPPPPPLSFPTSSNTQQVGWPTGGTPGHPHNNPGAARAHTGQNVGGMSQGNQGFQPGHSFVPSMDSGAHVWLPQSSQPQGGSDQRSGQQRHYPAGDDSFLSMSPRNSLSAESSQSVPASAYPSNVHGGTSGNQPVPSSSRRVPQNTRPRGDESFVNMVSSGSESGSPRSSTSSYRTAPQSPTSPTSPTSRHHGQSTNTAADTSTSGTPSTSRSKKA